MALTQDITALTAGEPLPKSIAAGTTPSVDPRAVLVTLATRQDAMRSAGPVKFYSTLSAALTAGAAGNLTVGWTITVGPSTSPTVYLVLDNPGRLVPLLGGAAVPWAVSDPAVLPFWGAPTWREEFDQVDSRTPSGVNPDKWNVRDGQTLSYDEVYYTARASNVYVSNGNLGIVAVRETGAKSLGGGTQPSTKGWTSGYIDTIGKFSASYGRWECRAKLNTALTGTRGVWPAIWTRPNDGGDGEFDLMEAYGEPTIRTDYRSGSAQATLWQSYASNVHPNSWLTPSNNNPNLFAAFHTYALEWTPNYIAFFRDDVEYFRRTPADIAWYNSSYGPGRPYHFRLMVQMGNSFWGNTDVTNTVSPTAPFQVDYVRYWPLPA